MTELSCRSQVALSHLRDGIEAAGYPGFLAQYGTELPRHRARAFDRMLLPKQLGLLTGFLECGEFLDDVAAVGLTPEDCDALAEQGLMEFRDGRVGLSSLRLVSHFGLILLCHAGSLHATAYHGEDSLALGRHLLRMKPGADVLDLCAGVGSQGLLAAGRGARVVSVELNESLALLQAANAVLNPVAGTLDFRIGDLFGPVEGHRFDAIFANPPLVPVPSSFRFALPNNGGPSGLDVTRRIANEAPRHLKENGELLIQGFGFGGADGPDLGGITDALEDAGFQGLLTCFYREDLSRPGPMRTVLARSVAMANDADESVVADAYRAFADHSGATHLHSWQLGVRRTGKGQIDIFPVFLRSDQLWLC